MSQSVKIYGLIFLACVCLLLFLDFDRKLIMEDSLFESVRTTQLSVMDESLNCGMRKSRRITARCHSWKCGLSIFMKIRRRLPCLCVSLEKRR